MPHSHRSCRQPGVDPWRSYVARFHHAVHLAGREKEYAARCLSYARSLWVRGVPVIYDIGHLCSLLGYDPAYVLGVCNSAGHFYRSFTIPKHSGGTRRIDEPLPSLKEIHHWILEEILEKVEPSRFAKAFCRGKSIKDNARFHRGQRFVLCLDIEGFFPKVRFRKVYRVYRQLGYTKPVAVALSNLCLLQGSLPQGAPTSPALSNLVCRRVDARISSLCLKRGLRFTRYADDITISGDFNVGSLINFVTRVLAEDGFQVNQRKTRVLKRNQRQQVTGVVVNDKLQVPRHFRAELRQHVYYIERYGLASHMERRHISKSNFLMYLAGMASHVLSINRNDRDARSALQLVWRLMSQA